MTKDEALKKCLRVLEPIAEQRMYEAQWVDSAIKACKEALEQPTQEPVAWMQTFQCSITGKIGHNVDIEQIGINDIPLYTHPKEWQGLSDDDIKNIFLEYADLGGDIPINACYDIYCDIEQKLKDKNS